MCASSAAESDKRQFLPPDQSLSDGPQAVRSRWPHRICVLLGLICTLAGVALGLGSAYMYLKCSPPLGGKQVKERDEEIPLAFSPTETVWVDLPSTDDVTEKFPDWMSPWMVTLHLVATWEDTNHWVGIATKQEMDECEPDENHVSHKCDGSTTDFVAGGPRMHGVITEWDVPFTDQAWSMALGHYEGIAGQIELKMRLFLKPSTMSYSTAFGLALLLVVLGLLQCQCLKPKRPKLPQALPMHANFQAL